MNAQYSGTRHWWKICLKSIYNRTLCSWQCDRIWKEQETTTQSYSNQLSCIRFQKKKKSIHYSLNVRNTARNSGMSMLIRCASTKRIHFISFPLHRKIICNFHGLLVQFWTIFFPFLSAPLYLLLLPLLSIVPWCRCPCGIAEVNLWKKVIRTIVWRCIKGKLSKGNEYNTEPGTDGIEMEMKETNTIQDEYSVQSNVNYA